MPKKDDQYNLHQEIVERFSAMWDYYSEEYQRNKEDCDFAIGEQWPDNVKEQRVLEGRPCLTENRLLPFVNKTVNDIRQARPSVIVRPVDQGSDTETADIMKGIIKNIEHNSDAETAYDTAAQNSIMSGYGWIRIVTDYADYDSFDQEIKIERVINPFCVMIDPNSKRMDGADMEDAFVWDDISKQEFEDIHPDADTEGFEKTSMDAGWKDDNNIRVAEYFKKEYENKTLVKYTIRSEIIGDLERVSYKEDVPEGVEIVAERKVRVCKIKWYKLSGKEILEEGEFLGDYIPIVPVYGFESWFEGRRNIFSLIHQSKDPQRMLNYWKSASAEIVALQPKAPWVIAEGQVTGYEQQWANANVINYPFMVYKPASHQGQLLPPPQRQAPPTNSGTMMQEAIAAADGIKSSLGIYDASLGQQTNDISGKAIISRQLQGESSVYHFVDNLSTSMKQVGRILVGLIPLIYSGQRIVRIIGDDGTDKMVPINQPVSKGENGDYVPSKQEDKRFQLDAGKYDIAVEVGPSYATKRQEAANAILELGRADERVMQVAGDLLVKALDIPYSEEISKRIKAVMDPSVLGDDPEAQRLQALNQMVNQLQQQLEQTQAALATKQSDQQFKNQIEMQKVELDKQRVQIEALKTMADIEKTNAEAKNENADAFVKISELMDDMEGRLSDVYETIEVLLSSKESEKATGEPESPEIETVAEEPKSSE